MFMQSTKRRLDLKVADETFLVLAMMHKRFPEAEDFSVREILDFASEMKLAGEIRPGLEIHVRQHCVANLSANPGNYRMLFASGKARRRLLLPGDAVHPSRSGKMWPELDEIPREFHDLIDWAKNRYGYPDVEQSGPGILNSLRGLGVHLGCEKDPDTYVSELRKGWS